MDLIEEIKYGEGLSVNIGNYKLSFKKNTDEKDFPKLLKKWFKKGQAKSLIWKIPRLLTKKFNG